MTTFKRVKMHLLNDVSKIEKLLERIGCEYIKFEQGGALITCKLPESKNKRSVQVRVNDSLSSRIRNRGDFKPSDIFNLVSYIHFDKRGEDVNSNLGESLRFICETTGLKHLLDKDGMQRRGDSQLDWLIDVKKERSNIREVEPNPVLPEEVMDQFYFKNMPLPYQGWIDEGISWRTQAYYGVGFDLESKRIVFPLKNRAGDIIGVKGRIMKKEDDPERKYLYLYPCQNSIEWFNLHFAYPYILMEKRVYIFESEKSCMLAHSYGVFNTVAIGASDITFEQARVIKSFGLDIEIVLCYDKDKTADEVKEQTEFFRGRKMFGIFDRKNLLEGKEAPVDKGFNVWNELVENNIYEIPTI